MQTEPLQNILHKWLSPVNVELPELYVVGGAVRDHLMARPIQDVDLACRDAAAFARKIADCQVFPAAVVPFTRDQRAPCYRVVNRGNPDDHIDVVNLRGADIETDLALRDFTVNALAIRIAPRGRMTQVLDCLGGRKDIKNRMIRVCADTAFTDDPLRILRAARLAALLDFDITADTIQMMKENTGRLVDVAAERITAELMTLLNCRNSLPWVRLLDETGALSLILPEISAAKGCQQNGYHHLDVWEHSLETLSACDTMADNPSSFFENAGEVIRDMLSRKDNLALMKLAALLHDVGKPRVKRFDPDRGRMTFHGHARRGAVMAADTAVRLRLSTAHKDLLTLLIGHHMRPVILSQPDVKKATVVKWFREIGDAALLVMMLAVADVTAKSGEKLTQAAKDRFFNWVRQTTVYYLEDLKNTLAQPNLVNGHDLIHLGLSPGPALGKTLAEIRKKQDLGEIADRDKGLELAKKLIESRFGG